MEKSKNPILLVLGNGFDLANDYKTSYHDYLDFIKSIINDVNDTSKDRIEFLSIVNQNSFIRHFLSLEKHLNLWIDVEREMFNIVKAIKNIFSKDSKHFTTDNTHPNIPKIVNYTEYERIVLTEFGFIVNSNKNSFQIPNDKYYSKDYGVLTDNINNELDKQLSNLKKSLTIYLEKYMPKLGGGNNYLYLFDKINPDYIVTFNYTNFYINYFDTNEVYHVHGSLKENNIVLGYEDDYPSDIEFIKFKKYFQKIQNKIILLDYSNFYNTDDLGQRYKLNSIFYGLSLDITDKEEIVNIYNCSDKVQIYFLDQNDYEKKVINLIEILGKEEFIKSYYSNKIEFTLIKQI